MLTRRILRRIVFVIIIPVLLLVAGLVPPANAAMLMIGPAQVESGGVRIDFSPDPSLPKIGEPTKFGFTILNATASNGPRPVKHVDAVVSTTLGGRPVLEAVTHTHTGILTISHVFNAPGLYRVAIEVFSTPDSVNPFMGGVPGDDFGSRGAVFWIAVVSNPQSVTVNGVAVEFESASTAEEVISNLVFRVKNATTGEPVAHVDLSLTIGDGAKNILATGQMHGHSGILGVSTVFPHTGRYVLSVTASTTPATPVKDQFGTRSASFNVDVQKAGADNTLLLMWSYIATLAAGAGTAALALTYVPRLRHRPKVK